MGIGDFLFGSKPSAQSVSSLSREQEEMMRQILAAFGPGADGAAPLTDPQYTRLSPIESTSLAGLEEMALSFANPSEATAASQGALKDIINTSGQSFQDYYKTNIADPIVRTFTEDIVPQINRQYTTDFFSSDRGNALDRSQRRVAQALVQGAGSALKDFRGQSIDAAKALSGTELTEAQANITDIEGLIRVLQGGGVPRDILTRERDIRLKALLQALSTKSTDTIAQEGSKGAVSEFLGSEGGSALMAAGIYAMMCHVAVVLYGESSFRTHLIRSYCIKHLFDNSRLGQFLREYYKHGKAWAENIRQNKDLKYLVAPIWDNLYHRAIKEAIWQ